MAKRDDPEVEILRLILKRTPDVPLDELGETLDKVGVPNDEASLARLITAAGYDAVEEPDGRTRVRPHREKPKPKPEPNVAAVATAATAADGRPAPSPSSSARPPYPAKPSAVVAVTIVAILLLVIVGLTIVRHDNGRSHDTVALTTLPGDTVPPAGTGTGKGKSQLVVAPKGPGSDPLLAVSGAVTDNFTQSTSTLSAGPGGRTWKIWRGSWAVLGGVAGVSGGAKTGLNLATLDLGTPNVRAQVKLPKDEPGAALAFRVVDGQNYWMIASAPQYGTFTVIQVVNGKAKYKANSGVTKAGAGSTIGVNALGTSIQLYLNGAIVARVDDPNPVGDSIGLATAVKQNVASFTDLIYLVK